MKLHSAKYSIACSIMCMVPWGALANVNITIGYIGLAVQVVGLVGLVYIGVTWRYMRM